MNTRSVSEPGSNRAKIFYKFVPVPVELVELPRCSYRAQLNQFWQVIYRNSTAKGFAWFYRRTAASWLGVSVRTIGRWIKALIELGLLKVERTGRNSRYFLVVEKPVEEQGSVLTEEAKMSSRYKDDKEALPTVVNGHSRDCENVEKDRGDARLTSARLKALPTEEFLREWRKEKAHIGLERAGASVFRTFAEKLGLKPLRRE